VFLLHCDAIDKSSGATLDLIGEAVTFPEPDIGWSGSKIPPGERRILGRPLSDNGNIVIELATQRAVDVTPVCSRAWYACWAIGR
jgi:hypothetical protein